MAELLKHKYNEAYINKLAKALKAAYPAFPQQVFKKQVLNKAWENMELKQRLHHITHAIHKNIHLPYSKTLAVLTKACKNFGGYEGMFFPAYVEIYGIEQCGLVNSSTAHWHTSMNALEIFTQVSSSEFAVRPFIVADCKKMMAQMLKWSKHKNPHVRRLASEGCRPRLPWAMALPLFKKDPSMIFPILDNLKADSSLYVRKSVANNLNDISKDHPQLVIEWCQKNTGTHAHTDWIIKRACRTLLKASNPDALKIFNYKNSKKIKLTQFEISQQRLRIGEALDFYCAFNGLPKTALRIEYAIHFVKKNGTTSPKKFHVSDGLNSQDLRQFTKTHSFQNRSTRVHYKGKHGLELFVNGISLGKKTFFLC